MNKICFIFINHNQSLYKNIFNRIQSSVDYIDFYNYNPDWYSIKKIFSSMMFNECKNNEYFSSNCIFVLLYFKLIYPNYDYYFICTNDVLFTGDYKLLFNELTKNIYDYDAIIQNDFWYPPKNWRWTSYKKYYNLLDGFTKENCNNLLYKFYCFSNELVDYIMNGYIDGYYGHQELCVSCMLKKFNGKYDYLINHFKTKIIISSNEITEEDLNSSNMILHPVKQY